MPIPVPDLESLLAPVTKEFTKRVAEIVETATLDRIRSLLEGEFRRGLGGSKEAPRVDHAKAVRVARGSVKGNGRATPPQSSPSRKASLARRIQGQYIGTLRKLKGKARSQVKAVAAREGAAAALAAAKKALRSSPTAARVPS